MQQAQLQPFSNRRGHAAGAPAPAPAPGVVFPFKQSYCRPVNGDRGLLPCLAAGQGARMSFTIAHITDPHLSPAPMPGFADLRLKRVMGFINWKRGRERLNDMGSETPGRGFARPAPRPRRRHRGSGQYRHGGRVPSRGAVDGDAGRSCRRQLRARQSRRLCARGHAAARGDVCALDHGRHAAWRSDLPLSSRSPGDRDHRPKLSRADRPVDGYGQARQGQLEAFAELLARNRRQGPRAGRAHPPPADRRDHAAAARSFRRGRVPAHRARARRRGDPARPYPPAGCPLAPLARRAHGRRAQFRSSARPPPPPPPATRAIAPPIIWSGSTATANVGGSAPGRGGSRRKARRSASGRRCGSPGGPRLTLRFGVLQRPGVAGGQAQRWAKQMLIGRISRLRDAISVLVRRLIWN